MNFWYTIIYLIVSAVITYALTPKAQSPTPEKFEDIKFPQAKDGTPQCVIFGDCWSSDWTVLAYGNYRTQEIHSDSGKK